MSRRLALMVCPPGPSMVWRSSNAVESEKASAAEGKGTEAAAYPTWLRAAETGRFERRQRVG